MELFIRRGRVGYRSNENTYISNDRRECIWIPKNVISHNLDRGTDIQLFDTQKVPAMFGDRGRRDAIARRRTLNLLAPHCPFALRVTYACWTATVIHAG